MLGVGWGTGRGENLGLRGLGGGGAFRRRNPPAAPLLSSITHPSFQELTSLLPPPLTCCPPRGGQSLRGAGGGGAQSRLPSPGLAGSDVRAPSLPPTPSHKSHRRHGWGGLPTAHAHAPWHSRGPHAHAYPTDLFSLLHFAFPWFGEEGRNGAGTDREEPAASPSGDNGGRGAELVWRLVGSRRPLPLAAFCTSHSGGPGARQSMQAACPASLLRIGWKEP